jgi:sulfite reductase alpha subunit-like flavoprotein
LLGHHTQGNFTQYSVGDHIAVWAEIGEEQVEEFAGLLGLAADQLDDFFILTPKVCKTMRALTDHQLLCSPPAFH